MSVDLVRIVDSIHRDKNIPKDILFEGIRSTLATAARKHYPEAAEIEVIINRETGDIDAKKDGVKMDPALLRPHRRPDRQAGHDPEDSPGRTQQHLRRIQGPRGTSSPAPSPVSKAGR